MSERKVLFIVEGSRGEPRLLRRLHDVLFGTTPENIYWHGTVIYDLLSRMFENGDVDDLDVVSVLRESVTDPDRRRILKQELTDVYLVFDMDPMIPDMTRGSSTGRWSSSRNPWITGSST